MIVAVCSDKGSPGVTTFALALGLAWPGERLVLEADPAGGDLMFRLHRPGGQDLLDRAPSVLTLAVDARSGLPANALPGYTQPTATGVAVIPGALRAEEFVAMGSLWPYVAREAATWPGVVVADVGRMLPGNAAVPVAKAATAVVLVTRPSLEGLFRLRHRVAELAQLVGDSARERSSVTVVVVAKAKERRQRVAEVRHLLDSIGSPIPIAGVAALDPAGVQALYGGEGRKRSRSDLMHAARDVAGMLIGWWPELAPQPQSSSPDPVRLGEVNS